MTPFNINKNFFIIIGTIIVLGVLCFIIYYLIGEIKNFSFDFVSEKNKITILEKEKENIKKIESIYKAQAENFVKIDNLFVDPEMPIEFIKFLEQTAESEQLKLEIISISKSTKKDDFWPSLNLELKLTGSFLNFLKFLEKIENCQYLIEPLELKTTKLSERDLLIENKDFFGKDITVNDLLIKVYSK